MEVRYTLDKAAFRGQIQALARTRGSLAWQQTRAFRWFVLFVFGLTVVVSGVSRALPLSPASAAVLGIQLVLCGLLAGVFWRLAPGLIARLQMRRLGAEAEKVLGKSCLLRLEEGILSYQSDSTGMLASRLSCPAAELRCVRADRFGLVLVLQNRSGLAVPASAFSPRQPLQYWRQALEQAMSAPAPRREEAGPEGLSRDARGCPVLVQRLDPAQAQTAFGEINRAVLRTGAYWRRNLPVLVLGLAALVCLVVLWLRREPGPAIAVLAAALAAAAAVFVRVNRRMLSRRLAGEQVTVFTPDAMVRTGPDGASSRLPYTTRLLLLKTPSALALYQPRSSGCVVFYRPSLSQTEEQMLIELLRNRFSALE